MVKKSTFEDRYRAIHRGTGTLRLIAKAQLAAIDDRGRWLSFKMGRTHSFRSSLPGMCADRLQEKNAVINHVRQR